MRFLQRFGSVSATVLLTLGALSATAFPSEAGDPAEQQPATVAQQSFEPILAAGDKERYLVRFIPGTDVGVEARGLRAEGLSVGRTFSHAVEATVVEATAGQIRALSRSGRVAAVEPDAPISVATTQDPAPWGLDRIDQRRLPASNSYTFQGSGTGVDVYVVDTGVRGSHKDFGGRVAPGWTAVADGNGSGDCNGHGTHVAGTVGGAAYGAAKTAAIVPVRVLDCDGMGTVSDAVAGLDWVAAQHDPGEAAVANLSIGGGASPTLDAAVQGLIDDGVTTVAAAGNSTADACESSPSGVGPVLTVAASNSSDAQASFSNFGPCIDLFAPGTGVSSTWHASDTATATLSGTSMAAPHVAGAAAVMLSQNPALAPSQVATALNRNATTGALTSVSAETPNRMLYSPPDPVIAPAPVFEPTTYIIPSAEGVRYAVNGIRQPAGEYQGESTVNVVASPSPGYTLTGATSWNHDFSFAFTDVDAQTKFADEILWAAEIGITTGWPDGTYRPLEPINRDAMAAFLYRLAGEPEYDAPPVSPFSDYPPSSKFYDEVTWLAETGITTGWPDGTYRPLEPINRDAMAAFLYRYSQKY